MPKTKPPASPRYMSGFGNSFETEALPDALPVGRNSPQKCNYGLYFRLWDRLCGTDKGLSQRIVAEAGHGAQVLVS